MRIAIAALLCSTAFEAPAKEAVVRWATAETSKRIYKGRCPVQLVLTGTITAARPGEFSYTWKRSDGATGRIRTVRAYHRGEMWRVREVWELSGSTLGWAQLWIPSEQRGSRVARFLVQCK
jgi:hypothetical protein